MHSREECTATANSVMIIHFRGPPVPLIQFMSPETIIIQVAEITTDRGDDPKIIGSETLIY